MQMKLWQSASAALVAVMFWIGAVCLPSHVDAWPGAVKVAEPLVALGFLVAGAAVFFVEFRKSSDRRGQGVFLGVFLAFAGVMLVVAFINGRNGFDLTDGQRLAIGVGGGAIASFAFAATQFDTIRAGASVPVVVLLVGVVTWPNAKDLIDPSVQKALITWMGVILGVNGAAEAVQQAAASRATPGQAAPGDLADRKPSP
jgi:peptidoglycan/LPS O-acetylase OafA/YrhL